jgi:hypothetical protein
MSVPAHQVRRPKRTVETKRGSVVVDPAAHAKRVPCLIVDSSAEGFRLRLSLRLRRGQTVEVIPDDDPLQAVRCSVVWVGRAGSLQEGHVGLLAERVL